MRINLADYQEEKNNILSYNPAGICIESHCSCNPEAPKQQNITVQKGFGLGTTIS